MRQIQRRNLIFLLIDQFALMSYAAMIEPFRAANILSGAELYHWQHVSPDGQPVQASNGIAIVPDCGLNSASTADIVLVFAAGDRSGAAGHQIAPWLRKAARAGAMIAGVSAGPYLLAEAGLLDGHRATIHWDHREDFEDRYPGISHEEALFVIDRNRLTCAGGMAGLDLAIEIIRRDHGHDVAGRVGDWFIRPSPRSSTQPQRAQLQERYAITDQRVLAVLEMMTDHLDEPVARSTLAERAGLSIRQLERLFGDQIGVSLAEHYRNLRLEKAAQLIRTTARSTTDIAVSCGFTGVSHFSRSFRTRYGMPPTQMRNAQSRTETR